MICFEDKVRKYNLKSLDGIIEIHRRCETMGGNIWKARQYYVDWCSLTLSDKYMGAMNYMDLVCETRKMLEQVNVYSGEKQLRKLNKYFSLIRPFTNLHLYNFPVVNEENF